MIQWKALIQANSATRNHLADHRTITLSTYGIIFLGTPHQGVESVDLALLLLQIQSIYSQTNDAVLKHLRRDSEFLQAQLSQYASISGNFNTKFFYEVYPTQIAGAMQIMASFNGPLWSPSLMWSFSLSQSLPLSFQGQSMSKRSLSIRIMSAWLNFHHPKTKTSGSFVGTSAIWPV
jgi:hypothetical protein